MFTDSFGQLRRLWRPISRQSCFNFKYLAQHFRLLKRIATNFVSLRNLEISNRLKYFQERGPSEIFLNSH